jgi:hypothetical protein
LVFKYGLLCVFSLTIKPTAILVPVIIAMAEIFNVERHIKDNIKRVFLLTFFVGVVYLLIHLLFDSLRKVNPSDNLMLEYMLGFQRSSNFWDLAEMVYVHWTRGHGSFHWRSLISSQLPHFFHYYHALFAISFMVFTISFFIAPKIMQLGRVLGGLFLGSLIAAIALPLVLSAYLAFTEIPFFFQPRYYTAYILISVILSVSYLNSILKSIASNIAKNEKIHQFQ